MKLLITGGMGFIGSAIVRQAMQLGHEVINLDALTYAGNEENIAEVSDSNQYTFIKGNICDTNLISNTLETHKPDAILHLAAESHVDRSIDGPAQFIETNIVGTYSLLEASREFWTNAGKPESFRFLHVSTDEVYGSLGADDPAFNETTAYAPNSPYSASKAGSDHLARAWRKTYGLPVIISNCSNNYGPYQYPEKLIPVTIISALNKKQIPIYGKGENVRDWLFVDDHANALLMLVEQKVPTKTYNIGGDAEYRNIDLVAKICGILDEIHPAEKPHFELATFVKDREGHDFRYAIDASRIHNLIGWKPSTSIDEGLRKTVEWYLENQQWWKSLLDK